MTQSLRIAVLFLVAIAVTTLIAAVADGAAAYVITGVVLFLVIAIGTPLALMTPRHQRAPKHVLIASGQRRNF